MQVDQDAFEANAAVAASSVSSVPGLPERDLTDDEISKLTDMAVQFCQEMSGVDLYAYEEEFAWRIIFSLLVEDAEEITALFSRQSGKTETVAVTVCGCMVLLPLLATTIGANDSRISKFKDGLWCGIYAPNYEQSGIMWNRMKVRMYSNAAKRTLLDPDINIDLTTESENMTLPNGSFVDCGTASPQASIEGKTYHLILLEETQDISSSKIRSSIHPMGAATAATIVKIGTPNTVRSDFFEACRRNKRQDVNKGLVRSKHRHHFEFDYTVAQRYNDRYRKYVTKERQRLGEDSDDFRMKYKLHWLMERGMFVNPDLLEECGIKSSDQGLEVWKGRGRKAKKVKFSRPPNVVTNDPASESLVAAIDVGRDNSTIVTIGKVFWDSPIMVGEDERYPIHVYNWLELYGDDHEAQHPQILDFLKNYRIGSMIIDATGKGDPVYSRIAAELDKFGIFVMPFIFSSTSKDVGYKVLHQEIAARRVTYPAGAKATRLQKWQRFYNQMVDLEKNWRGQTMVVNKPLRDKEARDDYPDCLMMLCYLVNVRASMEVETGANPFVGRAARWIAAEAMKEAGAWYRNVTGPPRRPGREGKWD